MRRPIWQERSGKTKTSRIEGEYKGIPEDPVIALKRARTGEMFYLDEYRYEDHPKRWISIGSDEGRDLVIQDDEEQVSALHCYLLRDRKTKRVLVEDAGSKNGTRVGGVRVVEGYAELRSGMPLSLGTLDLIACGRRADQEIPVVSGQGLQKCLEKAIPLTSSKREAARVLYVPHGTYERWLDEEKFRPPDDA